MADNYMQTSFLVECGSHGDAMQLHKDFLKYERPSNGGDDDPEHDSGRTYLSASVIDACVWFTDDGGTFSLDAGFLDFLSEWLDKHDVDLPVEITWAETCSKQRIGEFAGGAAVVTRQGWDTMTTEDALPILRANIVTAAVTKGERK